MQLIDQDKCRNHSTTEEHCDQENNIENITENIINLLSKTKNNTEFIRIFEKEFAKTKNNPNKSEILSKVMMKFTWIDVESGEKDENLFGANGQNDWDKGVGSALTYAERYFLLKFFHIATDEDDIDNPKIDEIFIDVEACTDVEQLQEIWNENVSLQKDAKFIQAVTKKKNKL